MNQPIAHHYVPKVYLKAFADQRRHFFQLRKKYRRISRKSISQVCYTPDQFKIQRDETKLIHGISDPLYIEKHLFARHENAYGRLLEQLLNPGFADFAVEQDDIRLFLEILVTIKRRNPTIRKRMQDDTKTHFNSGQFQQDIKPYIDLSRKVQPEIDPEEYLRKYIQVVNTEKSKLDDMYLERFLRDQQITAKIVGTLMEHRIFIYEASMPEEFITSDNPGFTLVGDRVLNVGGLSEAFIYVFPLTSGRCLIIDGADNIRIAGKKLIQNRQVESDAVDMINKATNIVAMEKLFAYHQEPLKKLVSGGGTGEV
jgi:hypothetical protein